MAVDLEAPLRADAQHNRELILQAARDAFVAYGPEAPVEVIARTAGVGTATVYRRFPDRPSLIYGVAFDVSRRFEAALRSAVAEERSAFEALRRTLHAAVDLRIGAILPALAGRVEVDANLAEARARTNALLDELIDRARDEGDLRPDAAFGDIVMIAARLTRPSPGAATSPELDLELAHRQLEIYLAGLRPGRADPLPGPALGLAELESLIARRDAAGAERSEPAT